MLIHKEIVHSRNAYGIPESSSVRLATEKEIENALVEFLSNGVCDHSLIFDDRGWMYDFRYCAICKAGLGVV